MASRLNRHSSHPYHCGGDQQKAEELHCAPVKSCCDASEVLQLVEASLDGIADLVGFKVVGDRLLSGRVTRDDGFGAHVCNQAAQSI